MLLALPEYANELKLNLSSVLQQAALTEQQTWGTAVASAIASRSAELTRGILEEAQSRLTPEALSGAKSAAALMGMNNIYFRFPHLSGNDAYRSIPSRLRTKMLRPHGPSRLDFELWCTAVSAINGCSACVMAHERLLRERGVTAETILAAIRIAAVIHGVAAVLDAEAALLR
jgi:alkyl hydroperoxide reductase subunit D